MSETPKAPIAVMKKVILFVVGTAWVLGAIVGIGGIGFRQIICFTFFGGGLSVWQNKSSCIILTAISLGLVWVSLEWLYRRFEGIGWLRFACQNSLSFDSSLPTIHHLFCDGGEFRFDTDDVDRDVAKRKQVEQALYESELKHRTLFEAAGDAILLMRQDRFVDCNARTLSVFGCGRDQIIGAPPYAFSPELQPDGRDSKEKAMEMIQLALTKGPQSFEWVHCQKNGTPFAAEVSLTRLELEGEVLLQAIVRDVTSRKQAEEALRISERKYRELVENANSIILHWTRDGRITFLNEFGLHFFGYSEAEILGQPVVGTIVPEKEKGGRNLQQLLDESPRIRKPMSRISMRTCGVMVSVYGSPGPIKSPLISREMSLKS